jgi:hypothetical protein
MFRGHYTFNSDALTFYELSGELMRPLNVAEPSSSQSSAVDSNVNLEITKVPKVILQFIIQIYSYKNFVCICMNV